MSRWKSEVETLDNPFRYAGEYLDAETGYYYLRARYYDPQTQRFISEDGVRGSTWNLSSLNLYTYAQNNPVKFIDPSGHIPLPTGGTLRSGSKGNQVTQLQTALRSNGYNIKVDGIFGSQTLAAVNAYKNKNGLSNTGIYSGVVGGTTWASLTGGSSQRSSGSSGGTLSGKGKENSKQVSINSKQTSIDKFVAVAQQELGYKETPENRTKYGKWYGMNPAKWCAEFVSYVANEAGILGTVVPKYAKCTTGRDWYKNNDRFQARSSGYAPHAGDVVFFSENKGKTDYHTGIVIAYDPSTRTVYTIEGNSNDAVAQRKYSLGYSNIDGYGVNRGSGYGQIPQNATNGRNSRTR
jgi:RHS repeat-associated protein